MRGAAGFYLLLLLLDNIKANNPAALLIRSNNHRSVTDGSWLFSSTTARNIIKEGGINP